MWHLSKKKEKKKKKMAGMLNAYLQSSETILSAHQCIQRGKITIYIQ